MDEEEALDEKRIAEGRSTINEPSGSWLLEAPISLDRDQTPKLIFEYAKPSVVRGIRLEYRSDTPDNLTVEPLKISFIVSSKKPGDEVFTKVLQEEVNQPVSRYVLNVHYLAQFSLDSINPKVFVSCC